MDKQNEQNDGKILVTKKRRERLIRKGRLKQERFRNFMRFFICVGIILGIFYCSKNPGWYMPENSFVSPNSEIIKIINNKIVPTNKILTILKDSEVPTVPIFMAKTNTIKKDILQLAPIENAYIRRFAFPARLLIIIRERTPVITISPDEKIQPHSGFSQNS